MRGGWVKNGDRWRVTDIRRDGAVVVKRLGPGRGGRTVLPAEYVAEHVDLGYAVTAHRAQGITVDTAHVVVTPSTTRENLYVSMTRGRESNIAYVALDQPDDSHSTPEADDVTARTVLYGVLQHSGADLSATQTIEVTSSSRRRRSTPSPASGGRRLRAWTPGAERIRYRTGSGVQTILRRPGGTEKGLAEV